jgi:hypothetical protein
MSIAEKSAPPLVAGDNMSRAEFLRRWHAHPEIKRAELIGEVVYMPSPVALDHGDAELNVGAWLSAYAIATPGTKGSNNPTVFLLEDAPQPDVLLRILPDHGGSSWVEGDYLHGPPELVAEICRSSAAYDLNQKLDLYQRAGVKEYLAILLYEQKVRWHYREAGNYQLLEASADGNLRSRVFPGLWLAGQALLDDKMSEVMAQLNKGLQSAEHARFVAHLAATKTS